MKLIEKKCPNCGAGLEFGENDKSCKCKYCHRSFEIERDSKLDVADIAEQFNLNELKAPIAAIYTAFFGSYIITTVVEILIFLVVFGLMAFGIFSFIKQENKSKNDIPVNDIPVNDIFSDDEDEQLQFISDISELSNRDIERISNNGKKYITDPEGENDVSHHYKIDGVKNKEKLIIASKNGSNQVIVIYRVNYHDWFHQQDRHTLYIPVVYENVDIKLKELANGKVSAPTYYFNSDQTCFTSGYSSYDEAYNAVVKPLDGEYQISEK